MTKEIIKRIEVKNLSKRFSADCKSQLGALSIFINFITFKKEKKEIIVADNISFDVHSGEVLGVIGKNGSGKSSLLRLIAEIYRPSSGSIKTHGTVVYLTGVEQGIMPKLTMRENIYLMGSVLGLSQRDIRKKFDDIVNFSGLRDHVDMKVYQFSTGMLSRLNFSVMINCISHRNPDILLIDEVLSAGGDDDFQEKATQKMEELIKGGAAVMLVSHDSVVLKRYCNRAMLLEGGIIKEIGSPNDVIEKYHRS
jgi:ABC-type polysaccharide/polyol phosphate transport system ATPase subunit